MTTNNGQVPACVRCIHHFVKEVRERNGGSRPEHWCDKVPDLVTGYFGELNCRDARGHERFCGVTARLFESRGFSAKKGSLKDKIEKEMVAAKEEHRVAVLRAFSDISLEGRPGKEDA